MASTEQELRREISEERERLAEAVDELREELGEATDVGAKLRSKLPAVAVGAFGLGFLKAGGVGATARLLFRRGREGDEKAAVGRFRLIDRG
jgi:predicted  nucleic acid-binding Zn-ribbon protein